MAAFPSGQEHGEPLSQSISESCIDNFLEVSKKCIDYIAF